MPSSSDSYLASNPTPPLFSALTKPMTLAPRLLYGYTRLESGFIHTPWSFFRWPSGTSLPSSSISPLINRRTSSAMACSVFFLMFTYIRLVLVMLSSILV